MSLTLIVTDDDPVVLFLHRHLIEKSSFATRAITFDSGKETLEYLRMEQGSGKQFLVFLDINMPGMTGWQFLDKLREEKFYTSVLIVMVSSSIDRTDREKALAYQQVMAYFEKPVNIEMINNIKHEMVSGQRLKNLQ